MAGRATLTMEPSSAFMNMARQTTTRAIQRRRLAWGLSGSGWDSDAKGGMVLCAGIVMISGLS